MHPALEVAEIVELICNSVDPDDGESCQETLSALARTATTFTHSALNGLWKEQTNLINVLRCLPADLWDIKRGLLSRGSSFVSKICLSKCRGESITFQYLLRSAKQIDLERLLVHAARVKALRLTSEAVTTGISGILAQIQAFLPRGFLFPHLRSITFEDAMTNQTELLGSHLHLFLPDSVTEITMDLDIGNWSLLPRLPPLHSSFALVNLRTHGFPDDDKRNLISKFLGALDRVIHLHVPTLNRAALEHLATLATLKSLAMYNADVADLSPGIIWTAGFPALTDLRFYGAPFEFISDLTQGLSNSPVASLYLSSSDFPTEITMRSLCLILSTHIAHSALFEVRLELGHDHDSDVRDVFDGHTISPLLCFSRIQKLDLESPGGFKLDDAMVWDMARAFPELRQLSLRSSTRVHCTPSMTLHGLRAFATHCPELRSISIAFDATVIPPAANCATPDVFQTELTYLFLVASPISSPPHVARFLSGIFPNLVALSHFRGPMQAAMTIQDCKNWDQVVELLSMFSDVRREERLRTAAPSRV
jgi:hypothetical protein